ncbi:hypothetical protein L1D14_10790 [Vibrio tubiashii]|uniref:hypothetical protein n=1 Tax=Vibrio tubiashii TaxID=29498 RepID=UPI001EFC3CD6|nr:hypothetical protein [Vibrio tubiashii]MCG9576725.1 hypothetical protein [Vibrio tubiashii]
MKLSISSVFLYALPIALVNGASIAAPVTQVDILAFKLNELVENGYDISPSYLYTSAVLGAGYSVSEPFSDCGAESSRICRYLNDSAPVDAVTRSTRIGEYISDELLGNFDEHREFSQIVPYQVTSKGVVYYNTTGISPTLAIDDAYQLVSVKYNAQYQLPLSLSEYGFSLDVGSWDDRQLKSDSGLLQVRYSLRWKEKKLRIIGVEEVEDNTSFQYTTVSSDKYGEAFKTLYNAFLNRLNDSVPPLVIPEKRVHNYFSEVDKYLEDNEYLAALLELRSLPIEIRVKVSKEYQERLYTLLQHGSELFLASQAESNRNNNTLVNKEYFDQLKLAATGLTTYPKPYLDAKKLVEMHSEYEMVLGLPLVDVNEVKAGITLFPPLLDHSAYIRGEMFDGTPFRVGVIEVNTLYPKIVAELISTGSEKLVTSGDI